MARFTWKIVDMMKTEKLFQWQGGPIILAQVVVAVIFIKYYISFILINVSST